LHWSSYVSTGASGKARLKREARRLQHRATASSAIAPGAGIATKTWPEKPGSRRVVSLPLNQMPSGASGSPECHS